MKPDKNQATDLDVIRGKIKFNDIDFKLKENNRMVFRIDSQQQDFIKNFSVKYGFTESKTGRFAIDVLRVMESSGLLKIFVDEYNTHKEQR